MGWKIAVLAAAALIAGCAAPFSKSQLVRPPHDMQVGEAVRVAARAMQGLGFWPTHQNEAAGYITAEQKRKDSFGVDMLSLYLQVVITKNLDQTLKVDATCSVSQNIVYTDELDDCVEAFYAAFDKQLAAQSGQRVVQPAPSAPPPAAAPRSREYQF